MNKYETQRKCFRTGSPATAGGGDAVAGEGCQRSGAPGRSYPFVRHPMARDDEARRRGGPQGQAPPGPETSDDGATETETGRDLAGGAEGGGVFDRAVDLWSCGGGDRASVRNRLPPGSCMEDSPVVGLELSEARAPGPGAGRGSHRPLEAGSVAAYKKKLVGSAPASSSWMKPASCCSLSAGGRGRRKGTPLSSGPGIGTIVSLFYRLSQWLPAGGASGSTSACRRRTSRPDLG